ncbi:MAG: DUF2142 domain-containing protein [Stomatobaculum sp.]|nr:DUF2142 domain-containing protein [Stomatobaculum sp.]
MNKNRFLPVYGIVPVLAAGLYYAMQIKDIALQTGDPLPLKLYALLLPAVLFGVAAAGIIIFGKRISLPRIYFVTGLFLGVLFIFVMPGLSAPDEMSHYLTAYRLSSRMLGKNDLMPASGLAAVRAEDYPLEDLSGVKTPEIMDDIEPPAEVLGNPVRNTTYRTIADWDLRYPKQEGMVSSGLADVRTTPVMYLPQAAGMALVRIADGNALSLVFAARFLNLLAFLFLMAAAVHRLPFGKEILCGVGLLPMTLHLAASMSYDAGIMGCSFLLCAEILRLAYGKEDNAAKAKQDKRNAANVGIRSYLLLCVLTAALSPCKMVYSCLVFLYLLIPADRFSFAAGGTGTGQGDRRKRQILIKAVSFCILLAVSAASIAAVNASIIRGYAAASQADAAAAGTISGTTGQVITEGAVVTGEGEVLRSGYTVSELLHRPFFIFRMVCSTFSQQSGEMIGDMMGMRLGNLDPLLGIPFFLAELFLLGLLLLAMKTETGNETKIGIGNVTKRTQGAGIQQEQQPYPGPKERIWIAAVAAGIMLLTAGAMLVSWTGRDSLIIEGIQGRYFLPVLPMLLMLLRNNTVVLKRDISRGILFTFLCMDVFALLRIFTLACMRI